MTQAAAWLDGAADDYYGRNKDMGNHGPDPVTHLLDHLNLKPKRVLEVGCGNGWRLKAWRDRYGCEVYGIDPSAKAVKEGNKTLGKALTVGTADKLPYPDSCFDVVVMGFCLFLTEPKDWFRIVAEADRVLAMNGFVFVYDFVTARPFLLQNWGPPEATKEETSHGVTLYEFNNLWLGHPCYVKAAETLKGITLSRSTPGANFLCIQAVTCLLKTMAQFLVDERAS